MKKLLLIATLALMTSACAQVLSSGAAVVNGDRISQTEVDDEVKAQLSGQQQGPQSADSQTQVARQVLGRLIQQKLLLQEATRRGIAADPAKVSAQYDQIKGQFPTDKEFTAKLTEFGLTPESLKARIRDSLVIDALGAKISGPITDAQVRAVYNKEQAQFREVKFQHILFTVDAKHADVAQHSLALDTRAKILAGANFGALAKKLSDDPGSKSKGGLYPDFQALSGLDPAFADAAWAAKIGVVTQPIRSQFGWHLIVTLAKRVQPFDQVKEKLRTQLATQSTQAAQSDFLRAAIKRAQVIVNPRYGDWDPASASIVAHANFAPPENSVDENAPGGFADQPVFAVPSASP